MIRPVLALLLLVTALGPAAAQSSFNRPVVPTNAERIAALDASKITFDDALTNALDHVINGLPYRIELTTKDSKPVYNIVMLVGDPSHHMTLDATDAGVIERHDGAFNRNGTVLRIRLAEPNVGLVQAMQLAEAEYDGFRAYSSEAIVKGDQVQFEVRMVDPVSTKYVTLSLAGDILSAGAPPMRVK
ncbi:MAG: PepSY domain-containing protein [Phycisphaerae bacterium]|nr:PepSY domain-containing protein [Phycisphaerae bacterium]